MASELPPNRIAYFRNAAGLSLRQLSLRLDQTGEGPTESTISRWERGAGGVPDTWKLALAELFGVSVTYLMGWEGQDNGNGERAAA